MPRRIQPPSLREASIQSIASNYRYWCVKQSESMPSYTSPFQYLRDDMIQEVMELLKPIGSKRIDFLFHPNLRRLSLNWLTCGTEFPSNNYQIKVIGTNCQNLTHLCLGGVYAFPELLCNLVSSLPHLVSLGLQSTSTDHTVLKAIAENCSKLLELDVRYCHELDEISFQTFFIESNYSRLSPQLTKLSLFLPNDRRCVEIFEVLLNSHRNIKSLGDCDFIYETNNCVSINQVFDHMYGCEYLLNKNVQKEWIRNLVEIAIRGRKDEIVDINLTILCCPYVTRLHLDLRDGRLNSLSAISKLKFLTNFSMNGGTFTGDIETVLEQIGRNLTYLDLTETDGVHVGRIGELCPNLQFLRLTVTTPASFSTSSSIAQHFSQLQYLYIISYRTNHGVPTETLSLMLENATGIKELSFCNVGNLTDRIISQADKKHGFRFLTKATFFWCQSLSKETGIIFLNDGNPLQYLTLDYCENVTWEDLCDLEEHAKHKRFNIKIKM